MRSIKRKSRRPVCLLPFVLSFFVIVGAGAQEWRITENGGWADRSASAQGLDESATSIQMQGFEPSFNIVGQSSLQPWKSNRPPQGFVLERADAYIFSTALDRRIAVATNRMVDLKDSTSTGNLFKDSRTSHNITLDLGSRFPITRVVFYPRLEPGAEGSQYASIQEWEQTYLDDVVKPVDPADLAEFEQIQLDAGRYWLKSDGSTLFSEDHILEYQVWVSNGLDFDQTERPEWTQIAEVGFTQNPVGVVDYPDRFLGEFTRFIDIRAFESPQFEIAEIQLFGSGFVPNAAYETEVIDLEAQKNLGRLNWEVVNLALDTATGEITETEDEVDMTIEVQVRVGIDNSPEQFFKFNQVDNSETPVSLEVFETLKSSEKSSRVLTDAVNWSPWSSPFSESGTLLNLPTPAEFIQFRLAIDNAGGSITEGVRIDELSFETSQSTLAGLLFGEISEVENPDPETKLAEVAAGDTASFRLDILSDDLTSGFNGLKIFTPAEPEFVQFLMGDSVEDLEEVPPSQLSVIPGPDNLTLLFPDNRVTSTTSMQVIFESVVLVQSTTFETEVFDYDDSEAFDPTNLRDLPQPVLPTPSCPPADPSIPIEDREPRPRCEDANNIDLVDPYDPNRAVTSNSLQVLTTEASRDNVLTIVDAGAGVITPNGDDVNDELVINYNVLQLLNPVPNKVEVFDLSGRRVSGFEENRTRGNHPAVWDGTYDNGKLVPPGVYVVKITIATDREDIVHTSTVGVVY